MGLSGEDFEDFLTSDDLGLLLVRPTRSSPAVPQLAAPASGSDHLTLKNHLGPGLHGGRFPAGLWARIVQRLLALNACMWRNWMIGAPVKRSLIAYDHL